MDVGIFREFEVLAEHKNFTSAAKALHISQPGLSKHIALLERSLKAELFVHSSRPLELTQAGEVFLEFAGVFCSRYDEVRKKIASLVLRAPRSLVLSGALSYPPVSTLVSCAQVEFKKTHPDAAVIVNEDPKISLSDALENDDADIIFVSHWDKDTHASDFCTLPLLRDPVRLIVHRNHPFAGRQQVSPLELADQRMIVPGKQLYADWTQRQTVLWSRYGFIPQFEKRMLGDVREFFSLDFNEDLVMCIASQSLPTIPKPLLSGYSVLGLSEPDCYYDIQAVYRCSSENPLLLDYIETLEQVRSCL